MKILQSISISIIAISVLTLFSCTKSNYGNETKISSFDGDNSHNNGQNCMTCHLSGGDGEGWFNAAGSVYDSTKTGVYANATIELFTEENGGGSLKASIEADKLGNFYTTESIDFSSGLFPVITGIGGIKMYMPSATTKGACNSCHGITAEKIWAK